MTDLADFLLARICEDEADVRRDSYLWQSESTTARPARVLAECEAKRGIIEMHKAEDRGGGWGAAADWRCTVCGGRTAHPNLGWVPFAREWPCPTLRLLALPYADHPDYRDEWRV